MEVQLFSLNGTLLRKLYSGKPTRHLETELNNMQSGYYYVQVILDNEIVYLNTLLKD